MNRTDLDTLLEQIRNIILNKPISAELKSESEELADLQEAICYLSSCLSESNEFLKHLAIGNLEVSTPSRHNFLSGSLKELHSGLRHMTWQANQVANGDYNQHVSFLGDFSNSFNRMIYQLSERESKLKQQSTILSETVELMKSIMDGLKNWIVVTEKETGEIIYTNQAAKQLVSEMMANQKLCGKSSGLLEHFKEYDQKNKEQVVFEFECPTSNRIFNSKSFLLQWNEKVAYAHYISDVTREKEYQEHMEEMIYQDDLTGLYNRRYCVGFLDGLLEQGANFSYCMIDLDGLKFVNDNFGHLEGDDYLKTVAREMLEASCSTDVACRIGGDEFAILYPDCNVKTVLDKMQLLDKKIGLLSKDYPMSISYGVIYAPKDAQISPEELMAQADEKMYIRKKIKKNGASSALKTNAP